MRYPLVIDKADRLVAPEGFRFASFDGLGVPAFIYRPQRAKPPFPVLIDI